MADEETSEQAEGTGTPSGAADAPVGEAEPETASEPAGEPVPPSTPPVAVAATGQEAAAPGDVRIDRRKVREGLVVSTAMDKTAVVAVVERVRHPRYAKTVQRTKRFYAHDEHNDLRVGDRVRLAETRPFSKLKRWRVTEVLERAK
jgi:small subunit ribosomal protein S17